MPLLCGPTADELLRGLAYPKFHLTPAERQLLLADYLPYAEVVTAETGVMCLFLQLALATRADALVSGDADLTVSREGFPIRCSRQRSSARYWSAPMPLAQHSLAGSGGCKYGMLRGKRSKYPPART